jgi:hypothetical protein
MYLGSYLFLFSSPTKSDKHQRGKKVMLKSIHKNSFQNQTKFLQRIFKYLISIAVILFAYPFVLSQPRANPAAVFDFDGDGKSDCVVVRYVSVTDPIPSFASRLRWFILRSSGGWMATDFGIEIGGSNYDEFVPEDYDGDGKWDIAIWRRFSQQNSQSYFYIWQSATNSLRVVPWGLDSDTPWQTQDFDGDGKADLTITRLVNFQWQWWTLLSQTNQVRVVQFGVYDPIGVSDALLRGDYDGDGKADIAVYRGPGRTPAYTFFIIRSSDEQVEIRTVSPSVVGNIVPGDFDRDRKTDLAFARSENEVNYWRWQNSSDNTWQTFETVTGFPVPGDYDGDRKTDVAIWRRTLGLGQAYFWLYRSRDGLLVIPWGQSQQENNPNFILQVRY